MCPKSSLKSCLEAARARPKVPGFVRNIAVALARERSGRNCVEPLSCDRHESFLPNTRDLGLRKTARNQMLTARCVPNSLLLVGHILYNRDD